MACSSRSLLKCYWRGGVSLIILLKIASFTIKPYCFHLKYWGLSGMYGFLALTCLLFLWISVEDKCQEGRGLGFLQLSVWHHKPRQSWGEGLSGKSCLYKSVLWACLLGTALIINWCRRAQLPLGSTILWVGGLVLYEKLSHAWVHGQASKQPCNTGRLQVPAGFSALTSLCDHLWPGSISPTNLLSPKLFLSLVYVTATKSKWNVLLTTESFLLPQDLHKKGEEKTRLPFNSLLSIGR